MNKMFKNLQERGFTLIEIILTLVIAAIMAAMFFTYSSSKSFTGSVNPIQWVQNANKVHKIMEMITADYQGYPRWKAGISYAAGSKVTPLARDGYYYNQSNSITCTSGISDPSWNTPLNNSVSWWNTADNDCRWTAVHQNLPNNTYIMPLATLKGKITTNATNGGYSANYTIVDNGYIVAGNNTASWDTKSDTFPVNKPRYLKVTIKADGGDDKVTAIFAE